MACAKVNKTDRIITFEGIQKINRWLEKQPQNQHILPKRSSMITVLPVKAGKPV